MGVYHALTKRETLGVNLEYCSLRKSLLHSFSLKRRMNEDLQLTANLGYNNKSKKIETGLKMDYKPSFSSLDTSDLSERW